MQTITRPAAHSTARAATRPAARPDVHPIFAELRQQPVIAAVRESKHLDRALSSRVRTIFMMGGTVSEAPEITRRIQEAGKHIFFHVELVKGLGRDREAIEYLAGTARPDGVVSTKSQLVGFTRRLGLLSVLQVFMIDTQAYLTGIKNIKSAGPDAVEIMPGLMPSIIRKIDEQFSLPIITAGLVKKPGEIETMLAAGADGLAISEQSLWDHAP